MNYLCAACGQVIADPLKYVEHTEQHIVDLLKHDHPDWVEQNGICKKCLEYYRAELHGSTFKDAPCVLRQRKVKSVWAGMKRVLGQKE